MRKLQLETYQSRWFVLLSSAAKGRKACALGGTKTKTLYGEKMMGITRVRKKRQKVEHVFECCVWMP